VVSVCRVAFSGFEVTPERMENSPPPEAIRSNVLRAAKVAGVIAIAIFAGTFLAFWIARTFNPSAYGDYGFVIEGNWRVPYVEPGSSAEKAGILAGDNIDRPQSPSDRFELDRPAQPYAGQRVTFVVERQGRHRRVTLEARPLPRLPAAGTISQTLLEVGFVAWLVVGALLVLLRPNRVTWSFYLCGAAMAWVVGPGVPSYVPVTWGAPYLLIWDVVAIGGLTGFLVFGLRFPSNAVAGWRKTIDDLTPVLFVVFALAWVCNDLIFYYGVGLEIGRWSQAYYYWLNAIAVLVFLVPSVASHLGTFRHSVGLERERTRWVAVGLACACIGMLFFALVGLDVFPAWFTYGLAPWLFALGLAPIVVFPLTVAYAVIRYRVIDVRFVVSRALVFGVIAAIIAVIFIALDKALSAKVANSPSQTAIYAGVALLVGFALNAARQRIATVVDSLFFHQWHCTQAEANAVDDRIHRAVLRTDCYEPLTRGIAEAFSLASVALFERLADRGFVRVAAVGWPPRTIWHLLPDHPVLKRVDSLRPVNVEPLAGTEQGLPAGLAMPLVMIPISAGTHAAAFLLCSAHENGTGIDPDEIRAMRRICAHAGSVYKVNSTGDGARAGTFESRVHDGLPRTSVGL